VHKPEGLVAELSKALRTQMEINTYSQTPQVRLLSVPDFDQGVPNENAPDARGGSESAEASCTEISRDQQTVAETTPHPELQAPDDTTKQ
jgi:hypothetical protein